MITASIITTFKRIFTLIVMVFSLPVLAQTKQANLKTDSIKLSIPFKQKDTTYWIANFREFRDAIFQKNKKKAKAFLDFPLKNERNEIWYLIYDHDDKKAIEKLQNTIKPFTEADFEKHFETIFSENFVKSLLKIKTDELYEKGIYETPEIKENETIYIIYSNFNRTKKTLELNFALKTEYNDSNGELVDGGEFSVIYCFVITKQGHIKLKEVRIAG